MSLFASLSSASKKLLAATNEGLGILNDVTWKRLASKKTGGSSRNSAGVVRPKHRGVKYNAGKFVQESTMIVKQNKLRFHPGLNVGIGKNGTLFALTPGRVMVTSEKITPNMEQAWNIRTYGGREVDRVYKKHFHVIPEPQHVRFKRIA